MELRLIIVLLRRWFWLLLLGAVIGGAAGYYYSISQPSVYRSTTKIMVMQPRESVTSDLTTLTDTQLAETFRSLLLTRPVLEATSERVGGRVSAGQINSRIVEGTQLLEVTVTDSSPQRAAIIANTLVEELIDHNDDLQANRFRASEESLQLQIAQVEEQMEALRAEQGQQNEMTAEELAAQTEELRARILELNQQVDALGEEISALRTGSTGGVPSPVQARLADEKETELTLLRLRLNAATTRYEGLLEEGASEGELRTQTTRVLSLVEDIGELEGEIAALSTIDETPEQAAERQALLRQKEAELAFVQLSLDQASQRYQQLVYSTEPSGARNQDSQSGANMALYQQIYSSLLSNYEAVRLARTQGTPNVVQVESAMPGGPVRPNEISNALLGAVLGFIAMGSIAFVIEYLDDTLKTPEDIEQVLRLPVVGYVSDGPELAADLDDELEQVGPYVINYPRAPLGEAFRIIRTNLEFADVDDSLKTILVTSPGPSEGKTTIATNLAATFSQQQKRVILLDCDLRRPKIHKIFGISNRVGMTDVFLGRADLQQAMHVLGSNLAVVTSGSLPSNPAELLGSESMTQFLARVNEISDVVVIDSPPSIVSDAAILSAKVDGVVIVVQPGKTHEGEALAQMEQMQRAGARVVGVVLNKIPRRRGGYYSRYGYKYHYYRYGESHYYSQADRSANGQRPKRKKKRFRLFKSSNEKESSKEKAS